MYQQPERRVRPTDGVRAILLKPEERTGKQWSTMDFERRSNYSAQQAEKEQRYAEIRESLARERLGGWLYYTARDAWRFVLRIFTRKARH